MKNLKGFSLAVFLMAGYITSFAQKVISEGTITYDVTIQSGAAKAEALQGTAIKYLKGNNSRTDMVSPLGKEITIYNSKTSSAVILKEFSAQKLMISLTNDEWKQKNKMYNDIKFDLTGETKTIGAYNTKKAVATMADGKSFVVYYAPDLVAANKDYDATFAKLPGLPIQYEIESGKAKFSYTLSKISYDPVLVSQFDFPASGYRVMTYEESQKIKKSN